MVGRYSQSKRYLACAAIFAFGRGAFVLMVIAFILGTVAGEIKSDGWVYLTLGLAAWSLGALWIGAIAVAFILAFSLACDTCGRRQIWYRFDPPLEYQSPQTRGAFIRWLYPDELHDHRFVCPYCKVEYSLRELGVNDRGHS